MSTHTNQILVPIDFSEQSMIALSQTYNLARLTKAELSLLYVIEEDSAFSKLFSAGKTDKKLEEKIKEKLHSLADETASKTKLKVNYYVSRGRIHEEICHVAEMINALLIIMGAQGESSFMSRFIGANTGRVVTGAPCAVITIKGKSHRDGCKNIVLPLDLSKETKEKVIKAVEFAQYFNAAIRIMTVLNSSDEFIVNKLKRQLQQVKEFISERNVPCTSEAVENSSVTKGVLEYVKKVDADLLIIMTQDEMNIGDLLLGSTAQEIINSTDIPVLCLRPTGRETSRIILGM